MLYYDSLGDAGYPISPPCTTMACSYDEHLARGTHGVDYAVRTGTPVIAPAKGRTRNFSNSWAGNAVELRHFDKNGNETGYVDLFYHLSAFLPEGVYEPGDTIGLSGSTGDSTGPHIHWVAKLDGQFVRQWEFFTNDNQKPSDDMIYVRNMQAGLNFGFVYLVGQEYVHTVAQTEVVGLNTIYGAPVDFANYNDLVRTLGAFNIPADTVFALKPGQTWSRDVLIQQLIEKGGSATPAAIAKAVNDDVAKRMGS